MAELSSNRTGGNGVQVETDSETFTVMCSRSLQNLEFGHFGRVRQRNVLNFITHMQGHCFSHYILLFCDVLVAVAVELLKLSIEQG